jgi:hypothetical protein
MNKIVSAMVVAFAGAAAASLLVAWRNNQSAAKALDKEDIGRWEDDGGTIPRHSGAASTH